jgi:hypothetical protein
MAMSERPETYSAQAAEGVRPLSEDEEATERKYWQRLNVYPRNMEPDPIDVRARIAVLRLGATLDAARAERDRVEAEAATYRIELQAIRAGNWDGLRDTLNEIIDRTLSDTRAGSALIERVRELAGEVERLRKRDTVTTLVQERTAPAHVIIYHAYQGPKFLGEITCNGGGDWHVLPYNSDGELPATYGPISEAIAALHNHLDQGRQARGQG